MCDFKKIKPEKQKTKQYVYANILVTENYFIYINTTTAVSHIS